MFLMTVLLLVFCFACCWVVVHTRSIAVLSYSDSNIEDFVDAVFSVNRAFCERHSLQWISLSPSSTESPAPRWVQPLGQESDPRWEKVNCLLFLTTSSDARYKDVDYFVWLDADMMIVNFRDNFIAHWIDKFPTHDILISSEYHAETGIANTGSIILKNSEWSRHFLRRWWGEDHRRGHDQILFNVLYQSLATTATALEDLQSHIKLLPIRALNSLPPAYLTFSREDSVLHLMGERGDYRRAVFRAAEAAISRRLTENEGKMDFHVVDVGIDRAFLAEQLVTIMEQRIPVLLQAMNASSSPLPNNHQHHHHQQPLCFDPHPIVYLSETTQEFRELSLQYGQLVSTRASGLTAVSKRIAWLEAAIRSWQTWYDAFLTCYPPLMMDQYSTSSNHHSLSMTHTRLWVDVLNTLSLLENDWLTEVSTATARWELIEQTYAKVTRQLLLLVSWVQPGVSQRQVWSMIATLWQNQALVTAQRAVGTTDSSDRRVVVTPSSLSGTTFEQGTNLAAFSLFAIAVDRLHQVLDVYTRYLVGPFVPEDRWQPVSTWVEEHNSYRYRLARVYQQLGDVYCAMKAAAAVGVGVGVGVDDGDEVARASDAHAAAVQLWEDLLHLPSSSSSLMSMHDTTSTPTPSGDWQWQEDHHEYWQTIQHALQCLRLVGRVEPTDKEDPSHHHQQQQQQQQQQQRRQFFTQKLLVLRSLFPTVAMTMAPTQAPRPVKMKTSAPEQPIAPVVDSTSAVDPSMTTTSTATTSTQHPQSQQQKRRFRKKKRTDL